MMRGESEHVVFVGVEGSAKSAVMSLFNDLEGTAVIPVHDKIAFGAGGDQCFLGDIREIRRYLAKTNYAAIELLVEAGFLQAFLGTKQNSTVDVPFVFDFHDFEARWKERALNELPISNYALVDIIYQELWRSLTGIENATRFFYMSPPSADDAIRLAEGKFNCRLVFVNRKVLSCAWVKYNRSLPYQTKRPKSSFLVTAARFVLFIYRVSRFRRKILTLAALRPDLIHVVNFEDIVDETDLHLSKIYSFMDVEVGRPESDGPSFLGTVLSKGEDSYISSDVARGELYTWVKTNFGFSAASLLRRLRII